MPTDPRLGSASAGIADPLVSTAQRVADAEREIRNLRTGGSRFVHFVGDPGEPGFKNGWVNYDGERRVAYYVENGRTWLEGIARSGTGGLTVPIFTLPKGPAGLATQPAHFAVDSGSAHGTVVVWPNGDVCLAAGSISYVSLYGVSFRIGGS